MIAGLFRPALNSASLTLLRRRRRASLSSPPAGVRKNDSTVLFVYVHGALYSNPLHSTCRAHTVRRAQLQAQRVVYLAASPLQEIRELSMRPIPAKGIHHVRLRLASCTLFLLPVMVLVLAVPVKQPANGAAEAALDKYGSLDRRGTARGQGLEVSPHHGRWLCGRRTGRIYGRHQASRSGQVSSSFRHAGEKLRSSRLPAQAWLCSTTTTTAGSTSIF